MKVVRDGVLAAILGLLIGCASTQTRMIRCADELELRAVALADATRSEPVYDFAAQAHLFRNTLESAAGDQDVVLAFQQLWRSYHALRDQVDRLNDGPMLAGLKPVTRAFVDVEHHMTGYANADGAIYARGGYLLDPYYND